MSKIFNKVRNLFRAVRDKPVKGEPIPVEPGEAAEPLPDATASGPVSASAPAAPSTVQDKPVEDKPIPIEPGEAAKSVPDVGGSAPASAAALAEPSTSKVVVDSALETGPESAPDTGTASGGQAASPATGEPAQLDRAEERRKNKQYKESLSSACMWMETRFEANMCPREKLSSFKILGKLGKGGSADVFKVVYRPQDKLFALKVQNKRKIAKNNVIDWVIREKKFIHAMQCEFVVKLHYAFKDARNLYLVMDHASRGDLMRFFGTRLPERALKLYAAQMVLGLEYIHSCKIAHRDIKARNIFLCDDMYLKIGDFGLAKQFPIRTFTSVGTYQYMAPEMFRQRGYRRGIDFWAMGIIFYRLVYHRHPYATDEMTKEEVRERLDNTVWSYPDDVYPGSAVGSFLSGLLDKNIPRRLGLMVGGTDKIKEHEWFSDVSFSAVLQKSEKMSVTLDPAQPEILKEYDFIPAEGEEDFKPKAFEEF